MLQQYRLHAGRVHAARGHARKRTLEVTLWGTLIVTAMLFAVLVPSRGANAATPAFVQQAYATPQSTISSVTATYGAAQTAGDTNVIAVGWNDITANITSVTDSKGNSYSLAAPVLRGARESQAIYFAKNITGATANANTVTATFNVPARFVDLRITEYSGLDISNPLDMTASATGTAASASTPSVTTSAPNELIFGAGVSSDRFISAGSGFTTRVITNPDASIVLDKSVSAVGSYNVTANQTGDWVLQMATFRAAGTTTDTAPPSVPSGLVATAASATQINLSWTASTDDVGVTGYRVFRNGTQVAVASTTTFQDTGLSPDTTYSYTVAAVDAAGHVSAQSSPASARTAAASGGLPFPKSVSGNKRYLVDQDGKPWMMVGDSNQCMSGNLSVADMDFLFADRQAHGFNADWIDLICTDYTGGRSDYSTYDGIKPFTTPLDLSTVNEAYFARMDQMVQLAFNHGITLILDPMETGSGRFALVNSGPTKAFNYGAFLGNRYKNYPNIIWMSGNDYQPEYWSAVDPAATALSRGIRSTDPNHLQTVELNYETSDAFDNSNWPPLINLNGAYTYYPTYAQVLKAYNRPGPMPVFMVESNYEQENNSPGGPTTTDETLRRQEYWTMTSGATGQLYGHRLTWGFQFGAWKGALQTPAVDQFMYMKGLFASRPWYNLVPDQTHVFLTGGSGVFDNNHEDVLLSDYATAALTADGGFGIVYVPTQRTVTVDMSKMGGSTVVRWFDPTNNTFRAISGSPFANAGTRQFTSPGANSAGLGDWVLVLDAQSTPDGQPPSVPTGLNVTGVTSTQVSLSWTAATDNVGVAGYRIFRNGVLAGTSTSTSYTDSGLSPSTTYSYTVAAYDGSGNTSAPSSAVNATTTTATTTTTTAATTTTTSVPAPTTPVFRQVAYSTPQTNQSTVTATYGSSQTAGDTNILAIGWSDTTSSITSLTDSRGNTYQVAAPTFRGNGHSQAIYYAKNVVAAAAGSNTVTVRFDVAARYVDLRIVEYGGLDPTTPFDRTASGTGTTATATSPAVTTSFPAELIFGAGSTSGVFTGPGTGFSNRVITNPDGDIIVDKNATSAGSYTASANQSGGWVMQVATFRAAGQ